MADIEALAQEIKKLGPDDLATFRGWFARYDRERPVKAADVQRDFDVFRDLVNAHVLGPLSARGFRLHQEQLLHPGMWVRVRNATTGLTVYFEYASGPLLTIQRIDPKTGSYAGENFSIDDLLWVRGFPPILASQPIDFAARGLEEVLRNWVRALRDCADDVLSGDFAVYSMIRPIIENRTARNHRAMLEPIDGDQ